MLDDEVTVSTKRGGIVGHFERTGWARVLRRNGAHVIELLQMSSHLVDCNSSACFWPKHVGFRTAAVSEIVCGESRNPPLEVSTVVSPALEGSTLEFFALDVSALEDSGLEDSALVGPALEESTLMDSNLIDSALEGLTL